MKDTLTYRKVSEKDKKLIFDWSNEKGVRENSFNSEPILFEEHALWFDKKLKDENADYIICEMNGKAACFVRFDKNEHYTTVGINLDKEYRSKGYASHILSDCCREYAKKNEMEIHAFIKKDNIASIKSFEKAGFVFLKELLINNCESFEFKYQENEQ